MTIETGELITKLKFINDFNDKIWTNIFNGRTIYGGQDNTVTTSDTVAGHAISIEGYPRYPKTGSYGYETTTRADGYIPNPRVIPEEDLVKVTDNQRLFVSLKESDLTNNEIKAVDFYNTIIKCIKSLVHIRPFKGVWEHSGLTGFTSYFPYKTVRQKWEQPIIYDNGVFGGLRFAVSAYSSNGGLLRGPAWHAFCGRNDDGCVVGNYGDEYLTWMGITMYTPNPTYLNHMYVTFASMFLTTNNNGYGVGAYAGNLTVDGSNDNVNWTRLAYHGGIVTQLGTTVDLNAGGRGPFRYYRFIGYTLGVSHNDEIDVRRIVLDADEEVQIKTDDYAYAYFTDAAATGQTEEIGSKSNFNTGRKAEYWLNTKGSQIDLTDMQVAGCDKGIVLSAADANDIINTTYKTWIENCKDTNSFYYRYYSCHVNCHGYCHSNFGR